MSNTLVPDGILHVGQSIESNDQRFYLTLQSDSDLVLYNNLLYPPYNALWRSNTGGQEGRADRAVMQSDGNFVIYAHDNQPMFESATGAPGSNIVLQDDANLVIYSAGIPVWASRTYYPVFVDAERPLKDVESKKALAANARLHRNGLLTVDMYARNVHLTTAFRPRLLVVINDLWGQAIWLTPELDTDPCAARLDPAQSEQTKSHALSLPETIGRYGATLEFHAFDGPQPDWFARTCASIISAGHRVKEIKDAWQFLAGGLVSGMLALVDDERNAQLAAFQRQRNQVLAAAQDFDHLIGAFGRAGA